jgi:hypothetical protein
MFSTMACNADTGVRSSCAHIRDHVAPHLVGMLQFLGHVVEGAGKLSDFIAAYSRSRHARAGVVAVGQRRSAASRIWRKGEVSAARRRVGDAPECHDAA